MFDDIAADYNAAMARIGNDPNRMTELDDAELGAVAIWAKTMLPITEGALVERVGSVDAANAELQRVLAKSDEDVRSLVERGRNASRLGFQPTTEQIAALALDAQVAVGATNIELERRMAAHAGQVN